MDLAFFGIQGSGKGTQGIKTASKYQLDMFETGAELRRLAKEDSDLGKKVKSIIESGNLVPTEVVMEIVENFIHQHQNANGILFDGIPRSKEQASAFIDLLKKYNREFKGILIELEEEIALKRLLTRRICTQCKAVYPESYKKEKCEKCGGNLETRKDDNEEAIQTRINLYKTETLPVIAEFEKNNLIIKVDGNQEIEKVSEDLFNILDNILKK